MFVFEILFLETHMILKKLQNPTYFKSHREVPKEKKKKRKKKHEASQKKVRNNSVNNIVVILFNL